MSKTPFKLKSGNNIPFKKMGSSPAKQEQQSSEGDVLPPQQKSETGEAFQKWVKGSKKTVKIMLDRAKKKCAEKGGVWKVGKQINYARKIF